MEQMMTITWIWYFIVYRECIKHTLNYLPGLGFVPDDCPHAVLAAVQQEWQIVVDAEGVDVMQQWGGVHTADELGQGKLVKKQKNLTQFSNINVPHLLETQNTMQNSNFSIY